MAYTDTLRNLFARIGLYEPIDDVAAKEAVTTGLVQERSKVLSELTQHSASFKEKSTDIEATTDQRKGDLEELLDHIKHINKASETAQSILTRMLSRGGTLPLL